MQPSQGYRIPFRQYPASLLRAYLFNLSRQNKLWSKNFGKMHLYPSLCHWFQIWQIHSKMNVGNLTLGRLLACRQFRAASDCAIVHVSTTHYCFCFRDVPSGVRGICTFFRGDKWNHGKSKLFVNRNITRITLNYCFNPFLGCILQYENTFVTSNWRLFIMVIIQGLLLPRPKKAWANLSRMLRRTWPSGKSLQKRWSSRRSTDKCQRIFLVHFIIPNPRTSAFSLPPVTLSNIQAAFIKDAEAAPLLLKPVREPR